MLGLLVGVVTGLAIAPPADATTLTDVLDDIPRNNVRYCIPVGENPPGISLTQARALSTMPLPIGRHPRRRVVGTL